MKVLLYFENQNLIAKSGIGRALKLQKEALSYTDVEVTSPLRPWRSTPPSPTGWVWPG